MRATYLRVGLLALLTAGLLVGIVLFFGSAKTRHGVAYETYLMDSVQGLDIGAPVKYQGVAVGQVTSIGLVNAEYGGAPDLMARDKAFRQVVVRFEVDATRVGALPQMAALVEQGLRARIAPQGLTGQSYLELDFLDTARAPAQAVPWTPRAPFIPSVPSTLSQVQDAATGLLGKMQRVDINALADGLMALMTDLRGLLRSGDMPALMREALGTLRIVNAGLAAADVPGLAADLRQTLAAARTLAQGPETRALLRAATQASRRLTAATGRLPALLATLQDVARRADAGSADAEAALAPLLRDARAAVAALRETSEAVRQDPARAVLQGTAAAGIAAMRRRTLLAAAALGGCSVLPQRPYLERRAWPIAVTRPSTTLPRPGAPVLMVRTMRVAPGLERRGLMVLQPDGSVRSDPYEEWSVPPAEGVEDQLRRWLAASGRFAAVLAPGSLAPADMALEGELLALIADPARAMSRAALGVVLVDSRASPMRLRLQREVSGMAALTQVNGPGVAASCLAALAALFTEVDVALSRVFDGIND